MTATSAHEEKDFNRYELENAGSNIDNYFGFPHHPRITPEQDFINSKARIIIYLERRLACIRALSFETFQIDRRRGVFFKGLFPEPKCPHLAQCPLMIPQESSNVF